MPSLWTTLDHTIPAFISILIVVVILIARHIAPVVHYVALVAAARNEEGVTKLAKYMAHKTGGPRIHVGQTWEEFIPAAEKIAEVHQDRVEKIKSDS